MTTAEVNALRLTMSGLESRSEEAPGEVFNAGPDNDFHRLIAKGSRNRWLENLLVRDVYSLLRLYRIQAARRPDAADRMADHHVIIDRIHARDGEGAEAAMRAHLRRSRARMLEAALPRLTVGLGRRRARAARGRWLARPSTPGVRHREQRLVPGPQLRIQLRQARYPRFGVLRVEELPLDACGGRRGREERP